MPKLTTVSESLIELCKTRKEELGITNAIISEKTGLPESTVAKLFNGTIKAPSLETIIPISTLLNISIDSLSVVEENKSENARPIVQSMSAVSPIIDQFNKQLTDTYDKYIKTKRENFDRQLKQNSDHYERQIKVIAESNERHMQTLINGYERALRNKNRWVISLATIIISITISLLVATIYDIVNPDMGWIQYGQMRGWLGSLRELFML